MTKSCPYGTSPEGRQLPIKPQVPNKSQAPNPNDQKEKIAVLFFAFGMLAVVPSVDLP